MGLQYLHSTHQDVGLSLARGCHYSKVWQLQGELDLLQNGRPWNQIGKKQILARRGKVVWINKAQGSASKLENIARSKIAHKQDFCYKIGNLRIARSIFITFTRCARRIVFRVGLELCAALELAIIFSISLFKKVGNIFIPLNSVKCDKDFDTKLDYFRAMSPRSCTP